MSIFYTSIDAALFSLLKSLTPGQLLTSIVLITALSFSIAVGMCNTYDDNDDDSDADCDRKSACNSESFCEEKSSSEKGDDEWEEGDDDISDRVPYDEAKERFCSTCGEIYYKPNGRHMCSPEDLERWKEIWKDE